MKRKIIKIEAELCNGCGLCASACHEGAIVMAEGKAKLQRDDYCDGLGDCLPACPVGAISFEEREAAAYDDIAVKRHLAERSALTAVSATPTTTTATTTAAVTAARASNSSAAAVLPLASQLRNWPLQLKLAPVQAAYYAGAKLLLAADCSAFAYADFHQSFLRNHCLLMGCPKLDGVDYSLKLAEIIAHNEIKSLTVVRMEVPCCGGLEYAAQKALQLAGKQIPWRVVTISTAGELIAES